MNKWLEPCGHFLVASSGTELPEQSMSTYWPVVILPIYLLAFVGATLLATAQWDPMLATTHEEKKRKWVQRQLVCAATTGKELLFPCTAQIARQHRHRMGRKAETVCLGTSILLDFELPFRRG